MANLIKSFWAVWKSPTSEREVIEDSYMELPSVFPSLKEFMKTSGESGIRQKFTLGR